MNGNPAFETLLDRSLIARRVAELGETITRDLCGSKPLLLPVLDGAMVFAADLMREISLPLIMRPLKASSYGVASRSSGTLNLHQGVPADVAGQDILLIDDILDTGLTLKTLRAAVHHAGAASVRTCVLLRKESSRHLEADYIGFEIPDRFVVGYGLDLAGNYRNLRDIVFIPQEDVATGGEIT